MIKSFVNALSSLGKTLDKPTFIKEYSGSDSLIAELETLKTQIKDKTIIESIDLDTILIKYGNDGEKNVAYELKNSFIPMYILHDITVQYEDYKAQLDYVLITSKFICILETKKLNGDITINNDGDFIRHFKNRNGRTVKKEGMYSPISQNQRHVRILKELLTKENIIRNTPVLSLVVVANPKSIINHKYAKKEIKNQIVKFDQLTPRINKMLDQYSERENSIKAMERTSEFIMEQNVKSENGFITKYREYIVENLEDKKEEVKAEKPTIVDKVEKSIAEEPRVEAEVSLKSTELPLKDKLIKYRLHQSREEKVKAYFIFSNRELDDLLEKQPTNKEELLKCFGFGAVKVEKYGDRIIELINEGCA